ncbi:MAG: GspH/FimT family pseudopilin [Ketobacteraceae bacterium]|nr:GspH/FimT family pseudopilin [Ketobacteraceae bacterium]
MTRIVPADYRRGRGFTLIELMVALAVVAILLTVATPPLTAWVDRMKVLAETTELLESFSLGRQYAINSRNYVTICGTTSGNQCDGGWETGFLVFVSDGTNNEFVDRRTTPVLHHYKTGDTFTTQGNIRKFVFRPSGLLKGRSGSLLYCPKSQAVKDYRRIVVSQGGRIRSYTPQEVAKKRYLSQMSC